MITVIMSMACFAAGLYAGKKRARGLSWKEIATDFGNATIQTVRKAWNGLSGLFRRECPKDDAEGAIAN